MSKVLIADDSPFIQKAIKRALSELDDCEIIGIAENGKEAFDLYSAQKPDVVFMDTTMPVMDGIEAVELIRGYDPEARIILLGTIGDEEAIRCAQSLGVSVFLQKPFQNEKLLSALKKICS